ncbi:YbbC/YhhH family protein [Nitrospirillum sp. BR 11828]|uniref:YbbC/YhhH family protein n=1 Tax=Nitrospirillum sp. BR 11828 TaxID=3104325 RepID=UPI002ACAB0CC|nr:YbbC/YhhH family protein [Nitrospirillum sp. BR 11828]MDZ5645989.1 YbbC/YhhH family protein [Nitrospirillum sp. BR 11828]
MLASRPKAVWVCAFAAAWSFATVSFAASYLPEAGYVPNEQTAIAVAEAVLIPVYGKAKIELEKPLTAKLEDGRWVVDGHLRQGWLSVNLGGTAHVVIDKQTGQILEMIHGK